MDPGRGFGINWIIEGIWEGLAGSVEKNERENPKSDKKQVFRTSETIGGEKEGERIRGGVSEMNWFLLDLWFIELPYFPQSYINNISWGKIQV